MNGNDLHGDVDPFLWSRSSIGNAYFSNLSFHQLWYAVQLAETPDQLDAAIAASEHLNDMINTPSPPRVDK